MTEDYIKDYILHTLSYILLVGLVKLKARACSLFNELITHVLRDDEISFLFIPRNWYRLENVLACKSQILQTWKFKIRMFSG